MTAKRRFTREGDWLDDDDTIVIRGGRLDPATLRADAERYHGIYGEYGISVFAVRDATVDELAQEPAALHGRVRRAGSGRARTDCLRALQLAQPVS